MRDDAVERVFSLFTSYDRAVAMAGDLVEEREQRGGIWFWLHVGSVTFALWRRAATEAPLRVLALTLAGLALFTVPAVGGVAAVGLFPRSLGSPLNWLALSVFWWGGALWTGASLVAIAPRRGMAACASLAMVGQGLLIACGVTIASSELSHPMVPMCFIIASGIAVALLAGGAVARRRTIGVAMLLLLTLASSAASAQQHDWRDPSPHVVKSVAVADDVQLEVLDWGGSGPAVVLLAGLGDTAHVFDDLAPLLVARSRVVGVTRRAHGRSSAPLTGYGFARLAEDVVRVIDTVGLIKPVVIGHSIAGEELHSLGAHHATKIAGLVYIDAAFDRGDDSDDEAYDAVARTLPAGPIAGPADRASFTDLRVFLERTQGFAGPEAHLRARWVANADGTVARMWVPDLPIRQAISRELQAAYRPYNPARIRVPALALYAAPKSAADLMRPWYAADDTALRGRVEKLYELQRERIERHIRWFERFAARGRVTKISGAHHLFLSNTREVLQQIEGFIASIATVP